MISGVHYDVNHSGFFCESQASASQALLCVFFVICIIFLERDLVLLTKSETIGCLLYYLFVIVILH